MCAKKLSEDKERYKSKKVLTENGVPVPGLWQRLKKYYVYVSIIKNGRIVPTFIPLKAKTLQKAIEECQKLQAYWAKERNNFKIHEITENALKDEVYLLSEVFASALRTLKGKNPPIYQNYVEDAGNKYFLTKLESMIEIEEVFYTSRNKVLMLIQNVESLDEAQINTQLEEQIQKTIRPLEQKVRESIDNLFKEALEKEEIIEYPDFYDIISEEAETYSIDKKLETILEKQFSKEMFIPEDNSAEIISEKGEKISKALEHYQKNRRKSEELAFGTKSNTAFKIIQNVIYPLETQIRIVKALLRYCPKEEQQASKS